MSTIFYTLLILFACLMVGLSICSPASLSGNEFLLSFMGGHALSLVSVIVTVTLVSITQVHLEYTRVERRLKEKAFGKARQSVNASAICLIFSLLVTLVLMIIGPTTVEFSVPRALIISGLIWITLLCALIMWSIIHVVTVLASEEPINEDP